MLKSSNHEPKAMPKIRCPKCEQSNLFLTAHNTLYCPKCNYTLRLFTSQDKDSQD
jgi:ribosomal protein S27AE